METCLFLAVFGLFALALARMNKNVGIRTPTLEIKTTDADEKPQEGGGAM